MGLIRAAKDAVSSMMADQWREYFYCDSLSFLSLLIEQSRKLYKFHIPALFYFSFYFVHLMFLFIFCIFSQKSLDKSPKIGGFALR